jgi:hypothetical protein
MCRTCCCWMSRPSGAPMNLLQLLRKVPAPFPCKPSAACDSLHASTLAPSCLPPHPRLPAAWAWRLLEA